MIPDEPILLQNVSAIEENIKDFFKHVDIIRSIAYRIGPSGDMEEGNVPSEELEIPKIDNSIDGRIRKAVNDMNSIRYQLERIENHFNRLV